MKMGEPGYWEREERHESTAQLKKAYVKDVVSFYLTIEKLRNEGIEIPEDTHYSADPLQLMETNNKIGALIAETKGLTIDDMPADVKKSLLKESKEARDMYIGYDYFLKEKKMQAKRVLDEDVKDVGKVVNVTQVIDAIKARENKTSMLHAKGKDMTD